MNTDELIASVRAMERDRAPDGLVWVHMRDISALADEVERLRALAVEPVAAERERCARVCEAEADKWAATGSVAAERLCAARIRLGD